MTNEIVPLQKSLVDALWREMRIARDKATSARQEATYAEDRLNVLLRAMKHAGIAPENGKGEI